MTSSRVFRFAIFLSAVAFSSEAFSASAVANSCEGGFVTVETSKEETGATPDPKAETSRKPAAQNSRQRPRKTVAAAASNLKGVLEGKLTKPDDIRDAVDTVLQISEAEAAAPELASLVLGERHTLNDFISANPEKNLAVRAPMNILNAAQRMLALVYSQGVKKVRMPVTGTQVDLYPFFSGGTEVTDHFRIVGNEGMIQLLMDSMKAQARGDRSSVAPLLLVGSHGTGKSETLKLLGRGAEKLTTQIDNPYALHTFQWTRLEEIDALRDYYPMIERNGKKVLPNVTAPMGDSPYVILPEAYQREVLKLASQAGSKLIGGNDPVPFSRMDPVSRSIRNEIVQHYAAKFGRPLTSPEIVQALNRHIVIVRRPLGKTYGSMPLIGVQGNDIDVGGLFMSPNLLVRLITGANHDLAWFYNGKVFSGHGNAIMLDEILRNPKELIGMFLNGLESREIEVGGSPQVPFDALMIAATNTANLQELRGNATNHAAIDRFFKTPMRWSVLPHEVAQAMINGKLIGMTQKRLYDESAKIERANIDDLFPRMEGLEKIKTPDARYQYWFAGDKGPIAGSPHVLLFMAEIVAASRYELDPSKVLKVKSGKIAGSHFIRNPIERLQLYEGNRTIEADELRDVIEVRDLLKEGESGISARNAGLWLTEAINLAEASGTKTLTPGIVLRAFKKLLTDETIEWPSQSERLRWMELTREITSELLIPRLESDINSALANGDRAVKEAYFDMLEEMYARHQSNDKATSYVTASGLDRPIDIGRLERVKEIYLKRNGEPLSVSNISIFHSRQKTAESRTDATPNAELLAAIAEYYADLNTRMVGLSKIIEHMKNGNGSDDVAAGLNSLQSAMKAMGYNEASLYDALMLISDPATRNRKSGTP